MGKVTDAGGSDFEIGDRVQLADIEAVNRKSASRSSTQR